MAERKKLSEPVKQEAPVPGEALINKYRPETFAEVVGHKAQVKALENAIQKRLAQTFLFIGPSGTGKTTLARIAANMLGCAGNITEINAAIDTGVDMVRELASYSQYVPLGGASKAVILDECHMLSGNAVNALLKELEEPPKWSYWFLCTTDPRKLPAAIKTRALTLDLKPVRSDDIWDLVVRVAEAEKILVQDEVLEVVTDNSGGSPRQALTNLALCSNAEDADVALKLLQSAEKAPEAVDLARALVKGAKWSELQVLLGDIRKAELSPESVRHVVRAYLTNVILGAKSEAQAGRGLELLDLFSQPFSPYDGVSPLVLACGKAALS